MGDGLKSGNGPWAIGDGKTIRPEALGYRRLENWFMVSGSRFKGGEECLTKCSIGSIGFIGWIAYRLHLTIDIAPVPKYTFHHIPRQRPKIFSNRWLKDDLIGCHLF
jgi:hypothetical protein